MKNCNENLIKYNFEDFTFSNYSRLIELAKEKYNFVDFFSIENSNIIVLRHDIEFSIQNALKLAAIESKLGVKSTFFIQIHSVFYNPFDERNFNDIKKIINLGHNLGLHFDSHFWNINQENELEKYLLIDKETLEKYFEIEIDVFSFHNTNQFILSCEKEYYAGMLNVYSKKIKEGLSYITDSTGYWRFERLEHKLLKSDENKIQVLIHDTMWQDVVLPPRRRVFKAIDEYSNYLKNYYDETLKKFGAKNIDWEDVL